MDTILEEDFMQIQGRYDFSALKGNSVFLTGSTGLIGSQLVYFLNYLNQTQDYHIKIYALARSKEKVMKVFPSAMRDGVHFIYGDVLSLPKIDFRIDYLIHGASITSSRKFISQAVETIDIAINGTLNLLRLAREKHVKSFVYLSSTEAFGLVSKEDYVWEGDLGYIDIASPRSSYMESKRMCENLCACFAYEYGMSVKSIRLAQIVGIGTDWNDNRIAVYFARSIIEGTDIILKTEGKTRRPILYSSDAITAILTVLLKGKTGNVYTAANPKTFTSIRETAALLVERIARNSIRLRYEIEEMPVEYAPNSNLCLNPNVDKLLSLGWKPIVGLEESYRRMVEGMKKVFSGERRAAVRGAGQ